MNPARRFLLLALLVSAAGSRLPAAPAPQQPVPDQLDLKSAVGFAIENNFAIRQARERIRQQDGVLIEVSARRIPSVAAAGSVQGNSDALSQSFPASDRSWNLSVTATQNLYSGGAVRSGVAGARLGREAALLDLKSVIQDSILNVRIAFFRVLLAGEKIKVQEQNVTLLQQELKNASDRFDAGTASSFEKTRAEVALANARVPLITANNERRLAIEALRQQLGFTTNTPENLRRIPTFLGALEYRPTDLELGTALETSRARRPELQRLEKLVEAGGAAVAAAQAARKPSLDLVGGWQLRKGATNSFGDSENGTYIGLQSRWSVFDGRATTARISQARSVQEQSRLRLSEAQLAVDVQVRSAHSALQEARELAEASQKVVEQAQEALRLANVRYEAGTATQLDVLQTNVELTTARTNQVQAYYAFNVALAQLRAAMGLPDEFIAE
jgi:outer membrane protein